MFARNYTGENRPKTTHQSTKGTKILQGFVPARGKIRPFDLICCKQGSSYTVPTNSQLIGQPVTKSVLRPTATTFAGGVK